jgi:predicted glycoside hydrolase/deacetylase ChbG (UPF0249 family)
LSASAQPPCLIVNADDYGYYDCVSRGILHASREGIVTATGILATGACFDANIAWLAEHPELDLGVHLNLTDRAPLTAAMRSRLTRSQGMFPPKFAVARAVMTGTLPIADVRQEWHAQIARCRDKGLSIRFLNSHEHIHMLPPLFQLIGELAETFAIPHVRLSAPDGLRNWAPAPLIRDSLMTGLAWRNRSRLAQPAPVFLGMSDSGRLNLAALQRMVAALKPGTVYELMCHPGFRVDSEIDNPRLYGYHDWEGERETLSGPAACALLERHGVRLLGYRDLVRQNGRLTAAYPVH